MPLSPIECYWTGLPDELLIPKDQRHTFKAWCSSTLLYKSTQGEAAQNSADLAAYKASNAPKTNIRRI